MIPSRYFSQFLCLVRLAIGTQSINKDSSIGLFDKLDWKTIESLANSHGLSAIILDGIEQLPENQRPPKQNLLMWIGLAMQSERQFASQFDTAKKMAQTFENNAIRTYVLKGLVVAECYPNPRHRISSDLDCFLLPVKDDFDASESGNTIMEQAGIKVERNYYKNSTFYLPSLMVENHCYFTPFRGNKLLMRLEKLLQNEMRNDNGEDRIEDTCLYRPPVMVTAIFLIEHAYSHFLHEGLTWRHVLDWMMFLQKHKDEIDVPQLDAWIDEFGFRKFYDSFLRLGNYLLGDLSQDDLTKEDQLMLVDIWEPLDLHDTVSGFKGKLALAGNTWRARWKYKYFSPISMSQALWIQTKGFLFMKHPKLD